MPTTTEFPQGAPVWIDLQSADRDGAVAFYAGVFGWDVTEPREATGMFALASIDAGPVAAIGPLDSELVEQGARSAWTLYLAVDDLDAAVASAPDAGGRVILPPGDLGGGVRLALVADPVGSIVGFWEGGQKAGWARGENGAAAWFELVGAGADAALDFYAATLGMTVTRMSMGEGDYPMLAVGDVEYAGADASGSGPAAWRVYFRVDDIESARERIQELGGSVLGDTMRFEGVGAWAAARDPQGAVFSILQPPDALDGASQEGPPEND
jgi:Predicted enzyme related to lactoylglutathione lyase